MDTGEPVPGQVPSKIPQKIEAKPLKVVDLVQVSNGLDLTQFRATRGNIITTLNLQKTLKEARATSKTLKELDSYKPALHNCEEAIEKMGIELETSIIPVIQHLWDGLAEFKLEDINTTQTYAGELLALLEVQGMPLKKDIQTYIKAVAGRIVAPSSQAANPQLDALIEIFRETGINLDNPVTLELMQRNPPEVYFDSALDLDRNNLIMGGANYPSLKIGSDQKEGTGRWIFDAGERVIKVDRIPGNFGHGSIVERRLWDVAQKFPWLKNRLLPPNRWGFIRVNEDGYDRWHVFVEYPKVAKFYSGDEESEYYDIEKGADIAGFGGIVLDAASSNIAEYQGRWVITDYNNPELAAVYGGENYFNLLEAYEKTIHRIKESRNSTDDIEKEKQDEYRQQAFGLREQIRALQKQYSTTDYFKSDNK